MKKRLTVNVDAEVIPAAKRYARARGVTVSSLVEGALRELAAEDGAELARVEGDKQRDGERRMGTATTPAARIGDQEPDEFARYGRRGGARGAAANSRRLRATPARRYALPRRGNGQAGHGGPLG